MTLRILSFLAVTAVALTLPVWVFALGAFLYAFVFSPYELLVMGVLIDAQFAPPGAGCTYTLAAAAVFLTTLYIRPYFSFSHT